MEKARQELEVGIQEHTHVILDMKHRLNQLVTIARLPPELLTEVFLHFAAVDSTHNERIGRPYKWIRITHVCHHWREVALASPRLWSTIFVTNRSCVQEMLVRSKHAPLSIHAGDPNWRNRAHDAVPLVLQESDRIRHLELGFASIISRKDVPDRAPLLKTLILRSINEVEMVHMFGTETVFEKCDMPALERLEVTDVRLRWGSPVLRPSLTRLVFGNSTESAQPQSIVEVLNALAATPLLEHLELKNVLPRVNNSGSLFEVLRIVNLDRLSAIIVTDTGLSCAQLLQHLSFPATATITLDCLLSEGDIRHVCPVFGAKFSGVGSTGPARPLLTVVLQGEEFRSTRLKGWLSLHPVGDFFAMKKVVPPPHVDFTMRLPTDPDVFEALFASLPLSQVQNLCLAQPLGYMHLSKDAWLRSCTDMTEVRQLSVSRWGEGSLPEALSARIPLTGEPVRKGGRRRLQPFFPKLTLLRFEETRLRPTNFPDDKLLTRYQKSLQKRKKSRVQLEKLVISNCYNVFQADVDSLQGLAKEVQWDRLELYEDLETDSEMYTDPDMIGGGWDDTEDDDFDFLPFGFHAGPFWF